jgi:chromatin remodeling complex protein RSC6
MVDLIGLKLIYKLDKVRGVRKVTIVQMHANPIDVRILIQMLDAGRVECAGTADNTMHFIAFCQKKIRKVRSVLACDTSDECFFHLREEINRKWQKKEAKNREEKKKSEIQKPIRLCAV